MTPEIYPLLQELYKQVTEMEWSQIEHANSALQKYLESLPTEDCDIHTRSISTDNHQKQ